MKNTFDGWMLKNKSGKQFLVVTEVLLDICVDGIIYILMDLMEPNSDSVLLACVYKKTQLHFDYEKQIIFCT